MLFLFCEKDSNRCYLVLMSLPQRERGKVFQVLLMDGGRVQDQSFSIAVTYSTFSPVWDFQVGSHKYRYKSSNSNKKPCVDCKASSQKGQASSQKGQASLVGQPVPPKPALIRGCRCSEAQTDVVSVPVPRIL